MIANTLRAVGKTIDDYYGTPDHHQAVQAFVYVIIAAHRVNLDTFRLGEMEERLKEVRDRQLTL